MAEVQQQREINHDWEVLKHQAHIFKVQQQQRQIDHNQEVLEHQAYEHDSVIYSRSERPAQSVHWHAPSVPANLGRRYA